MKSWRIVAVLLLCLASVGSMACGAFGGGGDEQEPSQQLVEVVRGDLTVSVSGSGSLEVANEAKLTFGSGGKVDEIYVNEGDMVSEGDVLAKLDTSALELALAQSQAALSQAQASQAQAEAGQAQAEASLTQAHAALAQAKAALDEAEYNLDQLRRQHVCYELQRIAKLQIRAAESQVEAAESQVEAAESQLGAAELQLEAAELQLGAAEQAVVETEKQVGEAALIALCDGVVVSVDADEGDTVSTATIIVHLIDLTSMELRAGVDEIDIPSVKPNQRAIIEVDALPDLQLEGKVNSTSLVPTVEAGLVTYDVTIGFDVPEDSDLKVGMSATADIIINERSHVLLVPDRAIKRDSQGNPVVKVMVGEQVQEKSVVIGISDGYQTEIVSGLSEGETVVVELRAATEPTSPGGGFFGH